MMRRRQVVQEQVCGQYKRSKATGRCIQFFLSFSVLWNALRIYMGRAAIIFRASSCIARPFQIKTMKEAALYGERKPKARLLSSCRRINDFQFSIYWSLQISIDILQSTSCIRRAEKFLNLSLMQRMIEFCKFVKWSKRIGRKIISRTAGLWPILVREKEPGGCRQPFSVLCITQRPALTSGQSSIMHQNAS